MKFSTDNASRILLGVTLAIGFTLGAGGIYPVERLVVLSLVGLSAFFAWLGGAGAIRRLFLPAAVLTVSMTVSAIPGLGIDALFQLLFFATASSLLASHFDSKIVLGSLVAGATILSGSVLCETARHIEILGWEGRGLGSGGFLMGANAASIAIAAVFPAITRLAGTGKVGRGLAIALALFLLAAILATGSRSGILALFAGSIPFLATSAPRKRWNYVFIAAIFVVLFAAVVGPKFLAKLDLGHVTNQQRISMLRAVARGAVDAPLLGHGPGSFPVIGQRYLSFVKWELHPHNFFLRALFEGGVAGLGAWLVVIIAGLRSGLKNGRVVPSGIALALLGGSVTDDIVWIPALECLLFLSLASSTLAASTGAGGSSRGSGILGTLILATALAAILPAAHLYFRGLPFEPAIREIERSIVGDRAPRYAGWRNDPAALFIAGQQALTGGEPTAAREFFEAALRRDPLMIFAPHRLGIARALHVEGRGEEARGLEEFLQREAPALFAYVRGDTTYRSSTWTYLDRHYKIEYPFPRDVGPADLAENADPLDWKHHRLLGARALARGDLTGAREALSRSSYLAEREYGNDPVLLKLMADAFPERAEELLARAERRAGPALPILVYEPLIYRYDFPQDLELRGVFDAPPR